MMEPNVTRKERTTQHNNEQYMCTKKKSALDIVQADKPTFCLIFCLGRQSPSTYDALYLKF